MMVGGGREAAEKGRSLDYGAWITSDSQGTLDTRGVKFSDGCKFGMNSPSFEGEEGGHTVQLNVLLFSVSFL
jgi:hypothetical protein